MTQHSDLEAIEARARAATPGPWVAYGSVVLADHTPGVRERIAQVGGSDTDHIAGMDPATTLALVAEVRALRAALGVSDATLQEPQHTSHPDARCPGCGRADCSWKRLECDGLEAHQPLRVLSNMGIPFVHCSCRDDKHPQSAIWLREHWTGTEDEGVAELRAVVARQKEEATPDE